MNLQPPRSPLATCDGVTDTADAYSLVNLGDAEALVSISVSQLPGDTMNGAREVPVESFNVEAGALRGSDLSQLSEDSNGEDNVLVPGQYLVLVGGTESTGYYLADG